MTVPSLRPLPWLPLFSAGLCSAAEPAAPKIAVTTGFSARDAGFRLDPVPLPAVNDAAAGASFTLIDGIRDTNGGALGVLHDGRIPASEDDPAANFFFGRGTKSGRISIDLGKVINVKSIATYSWHAGVRAPQVYQLYGADGSAGNFSSAPKTGTDPASAGWTLVAKVDTRKKDASGGQHAVSVAAEAGPAGRFRYLLFDVARSSDSDPFGQTFFSEIDVIDAGAPEPERVKAAERMVKEFPSADGRLKFVVDATDAPDLADWAAKELIPVVHEWYPKIAALLPSEGYTPPAEVMLQFKKDISVPAYAAGNQVTLNAPWFRTQLKREARGCVVHELVHVVQNYWMARRSGRRAAQTPGWIVEGIPDYIRWFLYEPQSRGAEIPPDRIDRVKFDDSYRVSANFFEWLTQTHGASLITKLNAAAREGRYSPDLWKEWTGKPLEELGSDWKKARAAGSGGK